MAIKFTDQKANEPKPTKKEVGGKTYMSEEPAAEPEADAALPYAKPARPEKKPRKPLR